MTNLPVEQNRLVEMHSTESVETDTNVSRFSEIAHKAKRGIQLSVIAAEVSPINEVVRYSVFAASQTASDNPFVGALAYGGSTLIVEGAAAISTASIFQGETSQKIFDKINKKMDKVISADARMSKTAEAGVAILGGSAVVMAAKHRENPSRTIEQNRKYGIRTSAWLAGVCAVQGYAMSEGIYNFSADKVGVAAISVAGVLGAAKWAKGKVIHKEQVPTQPEMVESDQVSPDYYLTDHEFQVLEQELVSQIKERAGETVSIAWIDSKSSYADLARTLEAKEFPEIPELMNEYEDVSKFLALVDTRDGADRIVHAFRLSSRGFQKNLAADNKEGFGIALVDDLLNSDQGLEIEEFINFYENEGIDINKCISVETNFRVGEKVKSAHGVPVPMLGYIAVFRNMERVMNGHRDGAVFAHLNKPAVMSLRMAGVEYESVGGRSDLQTPTVGPKKFDKRYKPIVVTPTDKNMSVFESLSEIAVPEFEF